MVATTPTPTRSLFNRLQKAASYIVEQPSRIQYSTVMAARFAFFLSQSLVISQLPGIAATPKVAKANTAAIDVPSVMNAVVDAILTDKPEDIEFIIPAVSEQPNLGSVEQRALFAKNFAAIIQVLRKDLKNIETGVYKMPYDMSISHPQFNPLNVAAQIRSYVTDRRDVLGRSVRGGVEGGLEVRKKFSSPKYPEYYLQNFHYQTDGWMSSESAKIYDYQVESLFMGTADAMRRQVLPDMFAFFRSKTTQTHLDIASGTGRFMSFVMENFPELDATCLDLSPFYLREAQRMLGKYSNCKFIEAQAERMPLPDASFDSISCVYMFHELPSEVRSAVVAEMARVLKPGGKVFFVDSAQKGEVPADRVLEGFTIIAHEPYYLNYTEENLEQLFGACGLKMESSSVNWVSKCVSFSKEA